MGEVCPKTKSYSQKLISTLCHIMIILRLTPPPPTPPLKKSPFIDSLIPSLLVGFLPPVQTSLQMTHLKSHQNQWTLSLCCLRMNRSFLIFYSISGTEVPAWVGENSGIPV